MEAVNIFSAENLEGRIDVARAVGSTATVMFIYDLAPGQSSCPYHYEYEEEWLLVIDGAIVLRAPDGERSLERGGVLIAFVGVPLQRTKDDLVNLGIEARHDRRQ